MRLLFVIDQFYKGGAETSLLNLLKQLSGKKEYEIDLVILNQYPIKGAVSLIDQVPKEIHVLDIYKLQKRISVFNRIRAKIFLTKEEKRCDPSYALLFVKNKEYDWAFHIGEWWSPAFIALKVQAKKKALWIHSDLTRAITFDPNSFFAYDEKIGHYIFVSQASMNSCLIEYPFIKEKSVCIYNISDISRIKMLADDFIEEDYFDKSLPVIVTCANIRKEKNHSRQLHAMAILKNRNVDFIWLNIGGMSDKQRCDELLKEAESLGLKEHFILGGAKENPYKYMAKADAVAVLSDYESWSMVITEAKVLGVPVIATKTSGALEQIVDEETGILTNFSALHIADQIEMLLKNKDIYKRIQNNLVGFDNTNHALTEFENLVENPGNKNNSHHKDLLYIIDDINYPSGAHAATKLQIQQLLKKGYSVTVFSSSIPSAAIRKELNGAMFLSWADFFEDRLYNRRLLDCLLDSTLSKEEKKYKMRLTWEGKFKRNAKVFDEMVFPKLSQLFSEFKSICVMSEGSAFRSVVASSSCARKVQYIHTDYCAWKNKTEWTKQITKDDAKIYENFDAVVLLTSNMKNDFLALYPHLKGKVVVNKNLMPVNEIKLKAKEFDKDPALLNFVTVGRVDHWKAYDRLFEALVYLYKEGYRFYWTIVGDGEDFNQINSLFKNSELAHYVTMIGQQANPYPYIKKADVFALLSKYEGLPNTIFEALILGIPVLATDVGGVFQQVQCGETGWIVENSEDGVYQGIKYILDHPKEIAYMKRQLENYQYDNDKILSVAEKLLLGE